MELQNFGWNSQTYVFLATLSVVLFGTWGLYNQNKKIWTKGSGKSVPVILVGVMTFLFISFIFYGIEKLSIACVTQGILRTGLCIPIMIGLHRFKGFNIQETVLIVLMSMVSVWMIYSSQISLMFLIFNIAATIAAMFQPWEMLREKSNGAVSMKFLITSLVSFLFWLGYGIVFVDPIIIGTTAGLSTIYIISILIWVYYWKKERVLQVSLV